MQEQIEIILDMMRPVIYRLSEAEKNSLLAEITKLLSTKQQREEIKQIYGQNQSNSISEVTFGRGSSNLNFSPVQNSQGQVDIRQSSVHGISSSMEDVLKLIDKLQFDIKKNEELNVLLKDGSKIQLEKLKSQLQMHEPDRKKVYNILSSIKSGLEGTISLMSPIAQLTSLVSKIFGVPVI